MNAVFSILNSILKPRLQEIGTLNFYETVKQFVVVELDQKIDVYNIAGVEAMGIIRIVSVSSCLGVDGEVSSRP